MLHYKDSRICVYHFKVISSSEFESAAKIELASVLEWRFKSEFKSDFFAANKVYSLLFAVWLSAQLSHFNAVCMQIDSTVSHILQIYNLVEWFWLQN